MTYTVRSNSAAGTPEKHYFASLHGVLSFINLVATNNTGLYVLNEDKALPDAEEAEVQAALAVRRGFALGIVKS